ncbi:MAG: thiamine-monophosphate kinase [Candidatus Omnitrophica bacterium CG_4_9_14_0_2_um_filter_42_8]|nr:MAG: thiamine-monophosphate kinase [Candidatus Omnitrophica bacterium CG_4_9_14_0_2_um_filter_42_8]
MRLKDLGEFNFIDRINKAVKLSGRVIKGIGDDAAVLRYSKDKYQLLTTDMLVEGKHFYKSDKAELVGKKAMSCNISDIAAMGGVPKFAVISVGLPGSLDLKYAEGLYKGIKKAADMFGVDLVGGDTVGSGKIVINIALTGEVEKKNLTLRSGAKENDAIFITGYIGGSIKLKHLNFTPRLKEDRFLVNNFKINSMIDVSDGLLADLGHILKESNKGAIIYENRVPVSKSASNFNSALRDGEDFELVFTLPGPVAGRLKKIWPFKTKISEIGRICSSRKGFFLVRKTGKAEKIKPAGFAHF